MGTKAWARNHINHLIWGNCFLFTLFGTLFLCHQWDSLSDMGMPPTWEKGSYLPSRTTKAWQIKRLSRTPPQLPLLNQIWPPLLGKKGAEVWGPPRDARNVTGPHWGWHRCTRWTGRLSHQTSNLSYPCNLLLKGCDHALARYQVQGERVVIYPVTIKQLKSHQLNILQKGSGHMHINKQMTLSILVMLIPR